MKRFKKISLLLKKANPNTWAVVAIFLILILLPVIYLKDKENRVEKTNALGQTVPKEVMEILNLEDETKQRALIQSLLEKYGEEKTQELLKEAGLPFTGKTHFLIHEVGDFVFKKYADDALPHCKDYFLSACYHQVIINQIGAKGIEGVKKMINSCEPAGKNVYFQCAHATGHGFLAYEDYDLPKALKLCDELEQVDSFLALPCHQGVFMENVWGVHRGGPIPIEENPWLSKTDYYYPCNKVDAKYALGCWGEQGTRIYQMVKGDIGKTSDQCDKVPENIYQKECFNNLARQINSLTKGSVAKTVSLCSLVHQNWQDYCVRVNSTSFWSLGDYNTALAICPEVKEPSEQGKCYDSFISRLSSINLKLSEKQALCGKIEPQNYRDRCLARLN